MTFIGGLPKAISMIVISTIVSAFPGFFLRLLSHYRGNLTHDCSRVRADAVPCTWRWVLRHRIVPVKVDRVH